MATVNVCQMLLMYNFRNFTVNVPNVFYSQFENNLLQHHDHSRK